MEITYIAIAFDLSYVQIFVGPVPVDFSFFSLIEPHELLRCCLEELEESMQIGDPFVAQCKQFSVHLAQL